MPRPFFRSLLLFVPLPLCRRSSAQARSLKIISNSPGATVELNGVFAGSTPFCEEFSRRLFPPNDYVVRPAPGARDDRASLAARPRRAWVFKSDEFRIERDPVASTFTGSVSSPSSHVLQPADVQPELSLEELVRRTKPAMLYTPLANGLDPVGRRVHRPSPMTQPMASDLQFGCSYGHPRCC
jgi:hypothetical protein